MGKALIIAEKPSVAADIAKALGGFKKQDDYYESDQYVLSSAVGHLLQLAVPEEHEVKRGKWTFAHLPVIPPHFDLKPIEKNEARLKLLVKLIKRKDVDTLINACDAGREGELIFRYIVRHAGADKPIRRLWLQSMTPAAIRDGFAALREDASIRPLPCVALGPAQPAARGERAFRLFRQSHPANRSASLRTSQGRHLPAHRFARVAGGLFGHGQTDAHGAGRHPIRRVRRQDFEGRLGE